MSRKIIFVIYVCAFFYDFVNVSDYVASKNKILPECERLFLNEDYPAVGLHA
jgi:hypothetical protein